MVKITVDKAQATKVLEGIDDKARTDDAIRAAAEAVAEQVRENFRELNRSRGRPRGTDFYRRAAESTFAKGKSVEVSGPRGIRQRLKGGTIRPRNSRFLAIPVHTRVIGMRAAEVFDTLGLSFRGGRESGVLVDQQENIMFALTRRVTQAADPSVLPDDNSLNQAAEKGLQLFFNFRS